MDNIIDIELTGRSTRRDKKLWQYDYGQMLRITGKEFPKVTEVQFSLQRSGGHTLDRIGTFDNGVLAVQIPNELLQNKGETSDYTIYAFVYLSGDESGNTKYMIQLPVESRPEPTDPSEDPTIDPSIFKDAVNAVNASAERAETAEKSARESAAKAKGYAESVGKSKEDVENARDDAITAIDTAKESALSNIASKTDKSVQKIQSQTEASQNSIQQSIADATEKKTELDASVGKAGEAKTALDSSISSAEKKKLALDATIEQANTVDASLKEQIGSAEQIQANVEQIGKNTQAISSLKEDLTSKADKTSLAQTDRKLDALWKLNQGISYEFQTDDTEAYQKTVPSGAKMVSIKRIGGKTSDNAGELMSAPVNKVVEQGKNYFDFSKIVSDGVNVMDYEKQTIIVPAYTNNTGYNQTLRDLCPGITPGTYVFSMQRSNPESGAGSYFLEATMDFPINTPIELTDELLDNHIAWYNNQDSEVENVISEIQIEKNSAKTSYSQYYQKSHKIPQAILELDGYGESGNFVDFVEKKYHKGDRTIDISDIMGDTFQEPIEVEAGGTLTFKNSNGDAYRVPVPSEEEYLIALAEVSGND